MFTSKYITIESYIRSFPRPVQQKLQQMRMLIQEQAPEAMHKIIYQMPTFYLNGNLVHFAAYEHHIWFYPTPSGISTFADELARYKNAKGSVQFPLDEPLPLDLIKRIVRYRLEQNMNHKRQ